MLIQTKHQVKEIVVNHLRAFGAGDVDALIADYARDALFITPDGTLRGTAEIRAYFETLLVEFPPGSTVDIKQRTIEDDVAYLIWSGESEKLSIPFATDTLLVRNGNIQIQTFAAQIEPKDT